MGAVDGGGDEAVVLTRRKRRPESNDTSGDLGVADQFRLGIPADQEPALIVTPESLHASDKASDLLQGGLRIATLGGRIRKLSDDLLDLAHFRPPIPVESRAPIVDDRSHRAQNSRGQEIDTRVGFTGECDLGRQSRLHEHGESVSLADFDVGELPRKACGSVSGFSLGGRQAVDLVVVRIPRQYSRLLGSAPMSHPYPRVIPDSPPGNFAGWSIPSASRIMETASWGKSSIPGMSGAGGGS